MKVYFYENGRLEKATGASVFKQSDNANTLSVKLPMADEDSVVYANFLLPYPKGSDQYGNFSVESLRLNVEADSEDGGVQWSNTVGAGYLNNQGTAYFSVKVTNQAGTITKTTERVKFEIEASGDYTATAVTEEQAEQLNAAISAIQADILTINTNISNLEDTKQDKADETLETTAKTVVGGINENRANIATNATAIETNRQNIATNRNDIDYLQANMQLSQHYIGKMSGTDLPTETQLTQFVRDTIGAEPSNGDVIIFTQVIQDATDKNFKYFYTAQAWESYELPAIEAAGNGFLGSVQGTYAVGDTADTLVDISDGKILNIYVLDGDGTYRNIQEYLNTATENIDKIVNGDTFVGNALRAVADGVGNNIVDTYMTQTLGATKAYVRDYAMPRVFNDVDFLSADGFVDDVPTTPDTGVQYTATSSAVGDTTLFTATKDITADFELSSKNASSDVIYIACDKAITATFRLTTSYKKSTLDWQDLSVELTTPLTFTAGEITRVDFGSAFTALGGSVVDITNGDQIRQTLEFVSTTSTELTWSIYSNETYPSTFNLTSQSYTPAMLEELVGMHIQLGMDGVIESNRVVFTVADADSYVEYRTNGREFLINAHLPVSVASVDDLDTSLPVAITFGDTTYNLYNYQVGVATPLTIGDILSTARYDSATGFTFDFLATFFENSDIVGFGIIPPAITATQVGAITADTDTIAKSVNGTKISYDLTDGVKTTLSKALQTAETASGVTEIVTLDTNNEQANMELGTGLKTDENTIAVDTDALTLVDYGKAQTLTDEQKAQARSNIGAGESEFSGSYNDLTNTPDLSVYMTKANPTGTGSVSINRKADTTVGNNSVAVGTNTTASGGSSHAEGNNTIASANFAHAEGWNTTASDLGSHAEGEETTASGQDSHAEGYKTTASGRYGPHAEGFGTTASGDDSHAEGYYTTASGNNSHAEGSGTTASGPSSHAEGWGARASGYYSHAEGHSTRANSRLQHVFGECNVEDTNTDTTARGTYVEIVGNGTDDTARSNARTLDWSGNEVLAGTLTINGNTEITSDTIGQITTNQNDINTLKGTTTNQGESIATNASDISDLQTRTSTIENAYVSYGATQTLTDEQKAQARSNIGVDENAFSGSYDDLTSKPTLNTDNSTALATNASETINGTISLHKVAKTGTLADLITDSTHTTLSEAQRTQISTNASDISTLQNDLSSAEQDIADNMTDIGTIEAKIPTQASASNQLADKDFVNSSINSVTAFYITADADGNAFATYSALSSATTFYSGGAERTPTRNDYCIVRADENHDNATTRYIYQNSQWEYQYTVNETALTADQLAAINSNITADLTAQISTNKDNIATNTSDISTLKTSKQDALTFDSTPTANSTNPVTSGGVYTYIQTQLGDIDTLLTAIDTGTGV